MINYVHHDELVYIHIMFIGKAQYNLYLYTQDKSNKE